MSELTTLCCAEHELGPRRRQELQRLLAASFPSWFRDRWYFKQLPHLRMLAYVGDQLVGQVGIDHRMIRVGDSPVEIFGLIDVCVDPEHRSRGVASTMLREIEALARRHAIECLLLHTDDSRLYERCGFVRLERPSRWLGIHEHATVGLIERVDDWIHVKPLTEDGWPDGPVDLLGYMF